jgi:hypothetical protein
VAEIEKVSVCMREIVSETKCIVREQERERMCVCECVCVCVRERERLTQFLNLAIVREQERQNTDRTADFCIL